MPVKKWHSKLRCEVGKRPMRAHTMYGDKRDRCEEKGRKPMRAPFGAKQKHATRYPREFLWENLIYNFGIETKLTGKAHTLCIWCLRMQLKRRTLSLVDDCTKESTKQHKSQVDSNFSLSSRFGKILFDFIKNRKDKKRKDVHCGIWEKIYLSQRRTAIDLF